MTDKNKNNSAPDAAGVFKPLLRGTVVFYNKDKGFGFIHTDDKKDFHFGHRAFSGTKLPEAGDLVEFTVSPRPPKPGKSPNVEHLEIVGKDKDFADGKEICPHCGKRMVPRMTTWYGTPYATYCPFCCGEIKRFYKTFDPDPKNLPFYYRHPVLMGFLVVGLIMAGSALVATFF